MDADQSFPTYFSLKLCQITQVPLHQPHLPCPKQVHLNSLETGCYFTLLKVDIVTLSVYTRHSLCID